MIEIFLEFPHVVEGGADREFLHCSEPVERAANSAGSVSEDTVSPAVVRVLALEKYFRSGQVIVIVIGWGQLPQYIGHHLTSH